MKVKVKGKGRESEELGRRRKKGREMVGWEWEGEWRSEMNGKEGLESVAFKGRGLREVGIFAELERERDDKGRRQGFNIFRARAKRNP